MSKDFLVQPLIPPLFIPSGKLILRSEAWKNGDWIGIFSLWIIRKSPVPSIIYQFRGPEVSYSPNTLGTSVSGHYEKFEKLEDGLREVKEEIGKSYRFSDMVYVGRKLGVSLGNNSEKKNVVMDIYLVEDESDMDSYLLQKDEVYAMCNCSIDELYKVHTQPGYTFKGTGLTNEGLQINPEISINSFPKNWDNYHFKMVKLIKSYMEGNKDLLY